MVAQLGRLDLRRIGDLLGQPRAGLARRFGRGLMLRLDQATGSAPESISPARPPHHFAVRLTLPDPIGLKDDLLAGIDRMLPRLCAGLEDAGRGVRRLRLEAHRTDQSAEIAEVGLARPSFDPERLRPLLDMKLDAIDAGFGIDMLRLEAFQTEPIHDRAPVGHLRAGAAAAERLSVSAALDDLIGRLGARIGLEAITRRHPASSHVPEKVAQILAAAWSEPARDWSAPERPRPLLLWRPEPVMETQGGLPACPVPMARAGLGGGRRQRAGADCPGVVAGRSRLAQRGARLLDGHDERRGAPVAVLCPRGGDVGRLVLPWRVRVTGAARMWNFSRGLAFRGQPGALRVRPQARGDTPCPNCS